MPTKFLNSPTVWEALLEDMRVTALVRNLATLTRTGVVAPGSAGAREVAARLTDPERLRKGRVHPLALVIALKTYAGGRGVKGGHWMPRSTSPSGRSSRPGSGGYWPRTCPGRWGVGGWPGHR